MSDIAQVRNDPPPARLRIALVAYVCGPDEGSEPGTGWAWARMLASIGDVTLITIDEQPRATLTNERIAALGLDGRIRHIAVGYSRWWPRPLRRFGRLSYLAWHVGMVGAVRRLGMDFDLAWHVTLANVWLGSSGHLLAPRFVLGPVGGGVGTPWRVTPALGPVGIAFEFTRTLARFAGRWLNPLSRAAWSNAALILAQNPETVAWLPERAHSRTVIFPHVALEGAFAGPGTLPGSIQRERQVVTIGRLLPWKGIAFAIRAMRYLPDWQLVVVGDGPDRRRLERLAVERRVADRVSFVGWLPRDAALQRLRDATAMLFPSIHDEGGWASAEALALGVPVIALDRGGPPVMGATVVSASTPERTARALAAAVRQAAEGPRPLPDDRWTLERQLAALTDLLEERGILSRAPTGSLESQPQPGPGRARTG